MHSYKLTKANRIEEMVSSALHDYMCLVTIY